MAGSSQPAARLDHLPIFCLLFLFRGNERPIARKLKKRLEFIRFKAHQNPVWMVSTFSSGTLREARSDVYEIELKLWRNEQEKNWTAEINGRRYERVAIEWVHAHVHGALLDAEESLIEIATELNSVPREARSHAGPRTLVLQ
jgi:hypothetical protein